MNRVPYSLPEPGAEELEGMSGGLSRISFRYCVADVLAYIPSLRKLRN